MLSILHYVLIFSLSQNEFHACIYNSTAYYFMSSVPTQKQRRYMERPHRCNYICYLVILLVRDPFWNLSESSK